MNIRIPRGVTSTPARLLTRIRQSYISSTRQALLTLSANATECCRKICAFSLQLIKVNNVTSHESFSVQQDSLLTDSQSFDGWLRSNSTLSTQRAVLAQLSISTPLLIPGWLSSSDSSRGSISGLGRCRVTQERAIEAPYAEASARSRWRVWRFAVRNLASNHGSHGRCRRVVSCKGISWSSSAPCSRSYNAAI